MRYSPLMSGATAAILLFGIANLWAEDSDKAGLVRVLTKTGRSYLAELMDGKGVRRKKVSGTD